MYSRGNFWLNFSKNSYNSSPEIFKINSKKDAWTNSRIFSIDILRGVYRKLLNSVLCITQKAEAINVQLFSMTIRGSWFRIPTVDGLFAMDIFLTSQDAKIVKWQRMLSVHNCASANKNTKLSSKHCPSWGYLKGMLLTSSGKTRSVLDKFWEQTRTKLPQERLKELQKKLMKEFLKKKLQ